MSSQSSSEDDDISGFAWTGVDQRNLELLFWDKESKEDHVSTRLIDLLRLKAESERLSKERKLQRRQAPAKTDQEASQPTEQDSEQKALENSFALSYSDDDEKYAEPPAQ